MRHGDVEICLFTVYVRFERGVIVKWDIRNQATVCPGTGGYMIQLPAGSTGFFEADAVQEHVGQTEFLRLGYP